MALEELLPHRQHVLAQFRLIALHLQNCAPLLLERRPDRRLARAEARPRERLVLPGPGRFALIAAESVDRADEEPAPTLRAQPQVDVEQHARRGAAGEPV